MIQKAYLLETLFQRTFVEAKPRFGKSVGRTTRNFLVMARKLVVAALEGFHTFVEAAEQQRTPRNNYWWDSHNTAQRLFEK